MREAIREPVAKPDPRKPYACSQDDLRASVERLKEYVR